MRLLLASASQGRREVLTRAGIAHETLPVDLDEEALLRGLDNPGPEDSVLALARAKCLAAVERSDYDGFVLGCDSLFEVGGQLLGKPHTPEVARERWLAMRGKTGVLHTGHWLCDNRADGSGGTLGATASTLVHIGDVSDELIDAYIATGEPLGVTGAFTIDGLGGCLLDGVEGDPHSVVGLSLPLLRELLSGCGVGIDAFWRG
ncbi:Maf family nucleotide pyrophosphatase [Dermabacteraceae bacterium TAE3-ERU27]|nr:Maf family nucleotide pyrophosphatase [Dermabacteraceae bacterium TAE3-ERU27]